MINLLIVLDGDEMGHNDEARREMVVYKANEGSQNKIARIQSMENNYQNY